MRRTLESLEDKLIKSFEILDFKSGESFYFLRVKAVLVDDSQLYIKEYRSLDSFLYWLFVYGVVKEGFVFYHNIHIMVNDYLDN